MLRFVVARVTSGGAVHVVCLLFRQTVFFNQSTKKYKCDITLMNAIQATALDLQT